MPKKEYIFIIFGQVRYAGWFLIPYLTYWSIAWNIF